MSNYPHAPIGAANVCQGMLQALDQVNLKLPPLGISTLDAFERGAIKLSPQTLRDVSTGETFRLTNVHLGTVTHKREAIGRVKIGYNETTREAWAFKKIRLASSQGATLRHLPAANDRAIAHLRSEGGASRKVNSPMAAQALLVTHKHMYLRMQLMAGDLLALRDEPDSREKHVGLLRGMVKIYAELAEAHAKGVAHRDIKPGNIFHRGTAASVCLGDFGVAGSSKVPSTNIAAPDFMSPEQLANINGATLSYEPKKADVWGVACTFLDLWLQKNPFAVDRKQRTDIYAQYAKWHALKSTFWGHHLGVTMEPFSSTFRALPKKIRPLFRLLLHPDCSKRPDAEAAAKLVAAALGSLKTDLPAGNAVYANSAARQIGSWGLLQAIR